mmetsp:Transcript_51065/g.101612  ORF Transcript_51065/g.101612 Transcript_51065/m.101612 type:complete len:272 (+) Transcript_51065:47-862(+)
MHMICACPGACPCSWARTCMLWCMYPLACTCTCPCPCCSAELLSVEGLRLVRLEERLDRVGRQLRRRARVEAAFVGDVHQDHLGLVSGIAQLGEGTDLGGGAARLGGVDEADLLLCCLVLLRNREEHRLGSGRHILAAPLHHHAERRLLVDVPRPVRHHVIERLRVPRELLALGIGAYVAARVGRDRLACLAVDERKRGDARHAKELGELAFAWVSEGDGEPGHLGKVPLEGRLIAVRGAEDDLKVLGLEMIRVRLDEGRREALARWAPVR